MPAVFFLAATAFLTAASAAALYLLPLALSNIWIVFTALNISTFIVCGVDKNLARGNSIRVPEVVLLLIAAAGGSGGLVLGMHYFRHKTRSPKFQLVVAIIFLLQVIVLTQVLPVMRTG